MTDDHHTPEGADGLREQLAEVLGAYDEEVLDYIMDRVAAEVHASNRRLLTKILSDAKLVQFRCCDVHKRLNAELEKLGNNQLTSDRTGGGEEQ